MLRTDCCAILGCLEKLFATRGEEKVKKKRKERNKLKMMTMKQSKLIIKYHLFIDSRCFFLPLVRGCLLLGTLTLLDFFFFLFKGNKKGKKEKNKRPKNQKQRREEKKKRRRRRRETDREREREREGRSE